MKSAVWACPMMMKHLSSLCMAGVFSFMQGRSPEDPDADPGVVVLFLSANEVDRVLQLPAVVNINPPLRRGKKHYLPIG